MNSARPAPILPLALVLTILLTAWWVALAWADIEALRLPEADDMVRLAQIRDWLDGQLFADPVQERLGPLGGTAMHWSRLPELAPALLIGLLSPLIGVTRAEIAAVIFWPELLLFLHLLLAGALARRLSGSASAAPAVALAALAFPAIALFLPGRIDHHGLQVVLVEALLLALLAGRTALAGAAAGASLLVGIEAAPVIGALMLGWLILWIADGRPAARLGFGLIGAALAGFVALRPSIWPADRCDGFTPPVFAGMLIAGGAWLMLASLAPRLPDQRWRAGAAVCIAALALVAAWVAASACFASPYGPSDPLVARIWPEQPGEYGGLFAQPPGMILAFLGLAVTGLFAALFALRGEGRRDGALLVALAIAASIATAIVQLRGAWFAAALAAPVLAALIVRARARGVAWQAAAWLVSAGLVWQALGTMLGDRPMQASCADRRTLAALKRLETGAFAAPMELSAAIIGGTQHRSLAGPYHRNAGGNRAYAAFLLATPEEARYQASLWGVDYVALCATPAGGLPATLRRPGTLAGALLTRAPPEWLDPVPLIGSDTLVWRVQPIAGLPVRP